MGFDQDITAGFDELFDYFGEVVRYMPRDGPAVASMRVVVARAGVALEDREFAGLEADEVSVLARADPEHAEGGLRAPRLGDRLVRDSDPEARAYACVLDGERIGTNYWTATFRREGAAVMGPRR